MNANSLWNSLGLLEIGDGGTGEVNVTLGGTVTSADTEIGSLT
jgi:T5SS/PEP-CTERM-associated repeat protein